MRLIDANKAKKALTGWETDPTDEEIEFVIDNLPTVDAEPVTCCRDCKAIRVIQRDVGFVYRCPLSTVDVELDGFCSRGTKREAG